MKLIHHVKKHGKTITLHLKKHHKKYIFGILSATLLWKGISLIAAYALVHNLSFSFADTVTGDEPDPQTVECTQEGAPENASYTIEDVTINYIDGERETPSNCEWACNEGYDEIDGKCLDTQTVECTMPTDQIENATYTTTTEITYDGTEWSTAGECEFVSCNDGYNLEDGECIEEIQDPETETETVECTMPTDQIENATYTTTTEITYDGTEWSTAGECEFVSCNDGYNLEDGECIEEAQDPNTPVNPEIESNGKCDRGDMEITSPTEGDIVGKTFDITREFKNDDCLYNEYIIKLRISNNQYLEIFTGNSDVTHFSFNSTELESEYFSGHKIIISSDEDDIIYWIEEGGEFTIDNKAPVITNTGIVYSTRNNKLNIGDTVTVSFESDEELSGVTVNIQGRTAYLEEKSGNRYKYTMEFSESNTTGKIVYGIDYSDIVGNTGYYEGYDNKELDYTSPTAENFNMTNISGSNNIKITFTTDEITNAHLVYLVSGTIYTNSLDSNSKTGHEFTLDNIKNKYRYNYSIEIEDEAKNTLNIGGDFYLSGDDVIFTNREISKSHLITEAGFKTGDEQELKEKLNSFDKCSKDLEFINMNLPINGMTGKLVMPNYTDSSVNQMTNAFTTILVKRIDAKLLGQSELDEIFEDLNNFLIVVKLVKDNNNACKQNMSQYYINRFKKTLIKYKLINN